MYRYQFDIQINFISICIASVNIGKNCPVSVSVPSLARSPSPVFDNRARGGDYLYSGNETSKPRISAPDHPKIQFSSKYSTPGCLLSNGWCHVVLVYQEGCQMHPSLSSSLLFLPNVV